MGGNVSLVNGHIDGSDRCAVCGRDIPEGRQVCVICGYKAEKKKADLVEVVRCKDCKYYEKWTDRIIFCNKHIVFMGMKDNDFCSYGVRKGEE